MEQLELSRDSIQNDIAWYQHRIDKAQAQLDGIGEPTTWKERKQAKVDRRKLATEIDLCRSCIEYARHALGQVSAGVS